MASEDKRKKKLASDSRVTLKVPLKTYLRLRNIQDDIRLNAGHVEDISSFPSTRSNRASKLPKNELQSDQPMRQVLVVKYYMQTYTVGNVHLSGMDQRQA